MTKQKIQELLCCLADFVPILHLGAALLSRVLTAGLVHCGAHKKSDALVVPDSGHCQGWLYLSGAMVCRIANPAYLSFYIERFAHSSHFPAMLRHPAIAPGFKK